MSYRYEQNHWKREDWEAHNRLMNAAIERQREEFLEDIKAKWEYLTVHMYETIFHPSFEKETEKVFKWLKEKWEGKS